MEQIKKLWEALLNFLVTYDSHKISQLMAALKWEDVLWNPYSWLIGIPIFGYLVYRKRVKIIVLIFSLAAFAYLLQVTFPPSTQTIPLDKLLRFIGGCLILGVLNLYLLFIRQD